MMKFHKFAATSKGPKYFAKSWACQDSSGTLNFQDIQVIAVADGHGSADCFRSEIGSEIAIEVLFQQIKIFFKDDLETFERFSDTGIKNFKFEFVKEWRAAVKKDWKERLKSGVLGADEIRYKSVSEKYKMRYMSENPQIVENYLYNAYGTTLICAISIGTQILILQIGDGTCVVLQNDGEFKIPMPPSEENFLNVTTSLCENKAELKIRHAILNCEKNSSGFPVAIFLSTDGLDDCYPYYRNEEHLYKLYGVIIENMLEFGYDATETEIKEELLAGMTKKGSQDDISLAYFVVENIETLKDTYKKIDTKYKTSERAESVEKIKTSVDLKNNLAASEDVVDLVKDSPIFLSEKKPNEIVPPQNSKIQQVGNIIKNYSMSTVAAVIPGYSKKN